MFSESDSSEIVKRGLDLFFLLDLPLELSKPEGVLSSLVKSIISSDFTAKLCLSSIGDLVISSTVVSDEILDFWDSIIGWVLVLVNSSSVFEPKTTLEAVSDDFKSESVDDSALKFGIVSAEGFCEECFGGVVVGDSDTGVFELFMILMIWERVVSYATRNKFVNGVVFSKKS